MRRPAVVFLVWGTILLALGCVLWVLFDPGSTLSFVLPAVAVMGALACSGCAGLASRRQAPQRAPRTTSPPAALLGVGLAIAVLAAAVGPWLALMALLPIGFGVFGLLREGGGR